MSDMPRKILDLSRPLENTVDADPPGLAPQITYMNHNQTAERMLQFFPGVDVAQLPGGEAWAIETVQISTHNGTHLDADNRARSGLPDVPVWLPDKSFENTVTEPLRNRLRQQAEEEIRYALARAARSHPDLTVARSELHAQIVGVAGARFPL